MINKTKKSENQKKGRYPFQNTKIALPFETIAICV